MEVQPRTLKLNSPAADWFQPGAATVSPSAAGLPQAEIVASLGRQLFDAAMRASSVSELVNHLVKAMSEHSLCLGLWLAPKRNGDEPAPDFKSLLDSGENQLWTTVQEQALEMSRVVQETGELLAAPIPGSSRRVLAIVPFRAGGKGDELLASCFELGSRPGLTPGTLLLLAAQTIALWRKRRSAESLNQINLTFSQTFQALQAITLSSGRDDAAIALVNHARQLLEARQVILATAMRDSHWRLEAISDVETIEMRGEHAASLCRCFDSFGQQKAPVTRQTQEPVLKQALSDYCHLAGTEEAMFLPLQVEGQTVGGLLIGMSTSQLDARGFSESATFLASQFSPVWKTFLRSGTTWYGLLWKGLVERCPVKMRKHWMWVVASLLVCFCLPVPYRVSCNSELQPVKRRYVAAPFEGVLDSVLARSGDVVEHNQLLATMDGSALQLERSGLQAQLVAAQKKRDAALAAGSIAESQIAKSEVRKCEAELALIDSKLSRLEMRSPMAGVVVSGDVDQVEGARLEMGKSLFEVAPLEKMTVEMRIPEVDARHVEAGQTARMKFSSYPFRTWEGQIVRVHPRSELVQDANVFIAEVELDNEDGRLRPGMKGWGKVAAGWKPLGWVWLHHAWERVRYVFVW